MKIYFSPKLCSPHLVKLHTVVEEFETNKLDLEQCYGKQRQKLLEEMSAHISSLKENHKSRRKTDVRRCTGWGPALNTVTRFTCSIMEIWGSCCPVSITFLPHKTSAWFIFYFPCCMINRWKWFPNWRETSKSWVRGTSLWPKAIQKYSIAG